MLKMQRLVLNVTERLHTRVKDTHLFTLRGNGIKFQIECHNYELDQKKLKENNDSFKGSLQYIKHYAGYPDNTVSLEEMKKALEKLSSTNTGIGVRIMDDPLPEFQPFSL
jgi:hypothetical protein